MTDNSNPWDDQGIWEQDFHVIDEKELNKMSWKNLKEDLINMWFLKYNDLSKEDQTLFDELADETREME